MTRGTMRGRLRRGPGSGRIRRGAVAVELAVVTPLLLTMVFGIMEFGWMFMVQETVTNATREACRVGVLQGSTPDDIHTRFTQAMAATGITVTSDMLTITEAATDDLTVVTVSASVPYAEVSIGLASFLGIDGGNIESVCSMRKEG